ncbi:hypothetical protein AB0D86_39260 [Streptomyces sp. NPDC048324]|uniref:hypothetical protein n=1 Tax=Streptomyces sp. NPDC048324 TaxID=3157205 RepID=UPI00342C5430
MTSTKSSSLVSRSGLCRDAFGSTNGSGNMPGYGSGVLRNVREDLSVTAVAALHQVLAE